MWRNWSENALRAYTNVLNLGLQLSCRIPFPHIYNPPRSRRPAHSLRIHRWLHAQCRPRYPDDLLLERASQQKERARTQDSDWKGELFGYDHGCYAERQRPKYQAQRIDPVYLS
jgi:hypothetical protein